MIRTFATAALALLSAGLLTFCASPPVHAQPAVSKSGEYIDCKQVAADVSLLARAYQIQDISVRYIDEDWYGRLINIHARAALKSNNPAQYIRDLHKTCLLENT